MKGEERSRSTRKARRLKPWAQHGSALLVTIFFLVLITGVALAFLFTTRMERATTHSHFERMRAGSLADRGVEQVVAILRRETAARVEVKTADGETRSSFRHYLTQPGALVVSEPPASGRTGKADEPFLLKRSIELSSGRPSPSAPQDPVFRPVNLNIQTLGEVDPPGHVLTDRQDPATGRASDMRVKWIYLRQNRTAGPDRASDWTEETDLSETPDPAKKEEPLIGRYAFWVDDESTKLNYNIAWKRDPGPLPSVHSNPSRPAHPSCVNTMALQLPTGSFATEGMADMLFRWRDRSPNRPFNTFADARQVDPSLLPLLDYNKFELTHYNHDPDTTFFGEDRILLTTRRDLVPKVNGKYARKFLDILRDDIEVSKLDPGSLDDIAGGQADWRAPGNGSTVLPNKFDDTVRLLTRYLTDKNWPVAPGSDFRQKFYPGGDPNDPRIAQLAVNIIDYVRAKESKLVVMPPLQYGLDAAGRYSLHASAAFGDGPTFQGLGRAPLITEMAMAVAPNPVTKPLGSESSPASWPRLTSGELKPLYPCTFKVELALPLGYQVVDRAGMVGINLAPVKTKPYPVGAKGWFVSFHEARASGRDYYALSPTTQNMVTIKGHATGSLPLLPEDLVGKNSTSLQPGKYVTVTKVLYREEPPSASSTALLRTGLYQGTSGTDGLLSGPLERWPCLNLSPRREPISMAVAVADLAGAATIPSMETDDPRCSLAPGDWQPNRDGKNTFGTLNSVSTLNAAPTRPAGSQPQQDTDESGRLSDASVVIPFPNGAGTNAEAEDNGLVTSVGELGYLFTGMDVIGVGTPWRSLRLQPNNYSQAQMVPDWALLDLFSVLNVSNAKVKEPPALYLPYGTSVGGRVNVNAQVQPFPGVERTSALRGVLYGTRALPQKGDATTIAENIHRHVLATGANPGKIYGYPGSERRSTDGADAYDSPGEICEIKGVADRGEKSEALVREIASLLTTRGGVFSIYTVGQALAQSPTGRVTVTAEHRQQTIVERYVDNAGTLDPSDDEVKFRVVYRRNLSP